MQRTARQQVKYSSTFLNIGPFGVIGTPYYRAKSYIKAYGLLGRNPFFRHPSLPCIGIPFRTVISKIESGTSFQKLGLDHVLGREDPWSNHGLRMCSQRGLRRCAPTPIFTAFSFSKSKSDLAPEPADQGGLASLTSPPTPVRSRSLPFFHSPEKPCATLSSERRGARASA